MTVPPVATLIKTLSVTFPRCTNTTSLAVNTIFAGTAIAAHCTHCTASTPALAIFFTTIVFIATCQ